MYRGKRPDFLLEGRVDGFAVRAFKFCMHRAGASFA
jgi:hypothetical protein